MTPTGGDTGRRNTRLLARLRNRAESRGGFAVFDSSTGFRLADGSVPSPDATAVRLERWKALRPEDRRGFPPLCPDLVVELASPGDGGRRGATALRDKMATSIASEERERAAAERVDAERLEVDAVLEGGEELPGLRLALAGLWAD